jgi:hypothetical protein
MLASFARAPRTQTAKSASLPAPLGGWNKRDALGAMDKMDAVILQNFWPGTSSVILRNGYSRFATGITGQVETLIAYSSGTSTKFMAAAGTNVYDVTAGGAVGAASLASLTNARWQYINMTTAAGSFILMVNGADKLRSFDGTAWHKDGDGAGYDITNVNTATCINIALFKNRVWLIETGTLKAWYLPINAIAGAAASLDMSSIASEGGYLMAAGTWTLDAGYGMDDYLAFITSKGEVIAWRLTDPTTPTGISLIGVYQVGSPVGRRCMLKYGGDLLIITQDGVVPMAGALQSSRLDPRVSLTDKITFAVSSAISSYGSHFGWQLAYYPKENQLYLNVPVVEGSTQQQYVMNTITKSWCNFTNWEANCFEIFNDDIYFGGNGFVAKAWDGATDNTSNIEAIGLQSFQYYGRSTEKQCTMIRPHFLSNGSPGVYGNVNVDYDLSDNSSTLSFSPVSTSVWGTATWDSGVWGSDSIAISEWQAATAIGFCFAPFVKTATQGISLQWVSTDLVFQEGGIL